MEIKNETIKKFDLGNTIKDFFKSMRVKTYINRLRISSIFLITLKFIQCYLWNKLNFYDILFNNWMLVMCASGLILFSNFTILFQLSQMTHYLDYRVLKKMDCIFYFSLFNFMVSLFESLLTLFHGYLTYFESIHLQLIYCSYCKGIFGVSGWYGNFFISDFDICTNCCKFCLISVFVYDDFEIFFLWYNN
jgi:hypothetical protein